MRLTEYLLPTLKENPADAEIVSHQLMMRAGMIRKVAAGIYTYLPLGLRSIRKVEQIVREEMDRAGAMELLMPMVVPAGLWEESGRWEQYGKELLRIRDRKDTEFCLGPTHEEVITDVVRGTVRSYRQLPLNLYQIQGKFRDEIRPRFGLMRGREFIMKDAYSFDLEDAGADTAYEKMYQAYQRIFKRCGLKFRAVEADTGNIGGSSSHEFMVLAESGEDAIVSCDQCDYAANVEKAQMRQEQGSSGEGQAELQKIDTPERKTIAEVAEFLDMDHSRLIKTLLVQTDTGEQLAVLLRGDRELNEIKLCRYLDCLEVVMLGDIAVEELTGAPVGFAGPVGLDCRILADLEVQSMADAVVGGNEKDVHYMGANPGRDFSVEAYADLRQAQAGDGCPRCDGTLQMWRGIEVGHVFKLGTKYSEALGATVLNAEGKEAPLVMGCYGIGIGRTVAAAIEQNHDDQGVIFPMPIAPFQVIITLLNPKDEQVMQAGSELYQQLMDAGVEVLLDDRDERPGSKFKDAELIGIPIRVTVGNRALKEGAFEVQKRLEGERMMMPVAETLSWLVDEVKRQLME
ncbi:proline--tRNA ligase [Desulfuromonas acetoxidans]|uniref:Proline--tRNA ligase n=1 Tax=Desulfuromonas acetoxidans (strain DSM 684 / 11070) TaxID=281689 RepID=Q1JXE2_DESA6|nr:proline--tRNA ligase [Desulfuromonas acetoxidans]EAT14850.1 prolyl-tRNA synthetase [Desulfuromonas acetoxidans DSM 684]MBF0644072.1 proline--tRNA ligase [Desulfuromonas acetoxidans]NVD23310.1 proline--tRNA ligase [Desulfuromonas acetoxidans]NVE15449.1 proline--tRNA ligase [Desulfuromonas acetoxidans]